MDGDVLLVPLDGTVWSEAALGFAEALARATNRRLRLLRVIETEFEGLLAQRVDLNARLVRGSAAAASDYLARVAAACEARGLAVESAAAMGSPAPEILGAAARPDVAAVIMATHGRGAAGRWALGSVADKVLRMGTKPVLLVRPNDAGTSTAAAVHRILVPLDGSPLAEDALEPARELALAMGAEVVLARAVPELMTALDWGNQFVGELYEVQAEMDVAAKDALVAKQDRLRGARLGEVAVLRGSAAEAIEDYVKRQQIDLIVMTTHGRGGMARLLLGNTAARLARSGVPVLVVHPKDAGNGPATAAAHAGAKS